MRFPTFAALPEPVDLAVLAIPAQHCVQAAADAAARGVGGIFIISGGFGETGEAGEALQQELARICRDTGLRLLGPNTSGFINPHNACVASFVPGVEKLSKGRVAVIAQSGGVNLSVSFLVESLGEGLSLAVGLGNAVDVDSADVLAMLADDPHTHAIALHLEGVPRGRQLFDVLSKLTPRKPVVALVAGRADIGEFAVSHTGKLVGLASAHRIGIDAGRCCCRRFHRGPRASGRGVGLPSPSAEAAQRLRTRDRPTGPAS